jgi:hypothetical protein
MSVRTNADKVISISVMGEVAAPSMPGLPASPYAITSEGVPFLLPAWGSIVYNVSVGDSAYGWLADCIHPGVSVTLKDGMGNNGLNILSCVGNEAMVATGNAKGAKGKVTGKSGRFSEQVIIHFDQETREKMAIGDRIVIRAKGVGLEFPDHPSVKVKSCSPELIDALELTTTEDGKLAVPVVGVVPAHLAGAGAGLGSEGGSIHIQTADPAAVAAAGLDKLRLGDIVAIAEYDSMWGHGYLRNAVGIGVVGQGDSPRAGYGPGLTLIMTSAKGGIAPQLSENVNIKDLVL